MRSVRYIPRKKEQRRLPKWEKTITTAASTKRDSTVAMAAPAEPSFGKPRRPKISSVLKTRFTATPMMPATMGSTVRLDSRRVPE